MNISERDKYKVISILNETLGPGYITNKGDSKHYCPFCHHSKKKLEVNPITQKFHCWVCDVKGRSIYNLLTRLDIDNSYLNQIREIYKDFNYQEYESVDEYIQLRLPNEFKPLWNKPKSFNLKFNQALKYLYDRNIGDELIKRYNIGYCDSGLFADRIIIPSYDCNGDLNYFIARSYFNEEKYKYKNPPVSKNVVGFESEIIWSEPITLVEGGFDAIQVRRNVIPLLGKFISKKLKKAIFDNGVSEVNIALDGDAKTEALKHVDWFLKNDIVVKFISLDDLDIGDLGFDKITPLIKQTNHIGFDDMIKEKLKLI